MTKTYKEFEEAPSGSVYFYNYKEPLMEFKKGYGFMGALIADTTSGQIQCHFCGGWFEILQHHLHKEHNMTAEQYKKEVGLNKVSALISEQHRAKLIKKGLEKRMKNLRKWKGTTRSAETRAKIAATLKENRAEKQNQNNTCPEQLLERLVKKFNELGYTPSAKYDLPFRQALIRVYGSYKNACAIAHIPYRKPGSNRTAALRVKWTKDYTIERVARFFQENGRLPTFGEYKVYQNALAKYGKREIFKRAITNDGVYRKTEFIARYDKTTLINFLRMFEKINTRKPSYSDCKRGLLPHLSRYSYNFGSWKKALQIAFPSHV